MFASTTMRRWQLSWRGRGRLLLGSHLGSFEICAPGERQQRLQSTLLYGHSRMMNMDAQ
jgi:predicted LPLAT superfamily acyltransferase